MKQGERLFMLDLQGNILLFSVGEVGLCAFRVAPSA